MIGADEDGKSGLFLLSFSAAVAALGLLRLGIEFVPADQTKGWLELAANVATALGAGGVFFAALTYWRSERRAKEVERATQKLRVHELFQAYLTMRFEKSLASPPAPLGAAQRADVSRAEPADSPEDQLAGSKLYALEEMLARVKLHGRIAPGQDWMKYSDPEYAPWIATLLTHLGQQPVEVKRSLMIYRECYTVDLIEVAAKYLRDPHLDKIARRERKRQETGTRTPPPIRIANKRRRIFTPG